MSVHGVTSDSLRARLTDLYCGTTGLDCSHVESEAEQEWLYTQYEAVKDRELEVNCSISLPDAE